MLESLQDFPLTSSKSHWRPGNNFLRPLLGTKACPCPRGKEEWNSFYWTKGYCRNNSVSFLLWLSLLGKWTVILSIFWPRNSFKEPEWYLIIAKVLLSCINICLECEINGEAQERGQNQWHGIGLHKTLLFFCVIAANSCSQRICLTSVPLSIEEKASPGKSL